MIVVYPMIVSNAVSENTLPALSKMLELYISVYMQNDLMGAINGKFGGPRPSIRYKIKKGKIIGESIDLSEADEESVLPGTKDPQQIEAQLEKARRTKERLIQKIKDIRAAQKRAESDKDARDLKEKELEHQQAMDKVDAAEKELERAHKQAMDLKNLELKQSKETREKAKHDKEMKDKASKVDLVTSDKTISIEPTTVKVTTELYGTQLLGIKVVPYRVISDAKLSHLLMHDMKVKGIAALTIPLGRKILGKMLRFTHRGPVSGDPKKDIIYRTTGHKGETFVVLEKNHDVDQYFLQNTKRINRLFKLGWGNFIIADDALGIANFCMRANKGICQGVSYRMMYKTLGQSGVYEDLEDLRKQNSSLFKMRAKRFSKLLGEAKVEEKLINYQERQ